MSRPPRSRDDEPRTVSLNAPFRDLAKLLGDRPRPAPTPAKPPAPAPPPAPAKRSPPADEGGDDASLFLDAVEDAVPIRRDSAPWTAPPRPPAPKPGARDDAEALAVLSDLVAGNGHFDVSDTDEHLEGAVVGLDSRLLRRLRSGEFSVQAHLDLHGFTAEAAKEEVRGFLLRALRAGHRCVLVVHGRGHNSPDRRSVLKEGLRSWLTRGELAQIVLAFSTARGCDGGAGATYVLLRRQRRPRRPFATYDGTKSRS